MKLYEKKRRSSKNMMKHSWIKINEPYKLPINELLFKNTFTIEISLRTKRKKIYGTRRNKLKIKKIFFIIILTIKDRKGRGKIKRNS